MNCVLNMTFQVGFDAGDGVHFYAYPYSRLASDINMTLTTNVNPPVAGRLVYKVQQGTLVLLILRMYSQWPSSGRAGYTRYSR